MRKRTGCIETGGLFSAIAITLIAGAFLYGSFVTATEPQPMSEQPRFYFQEDLFGAKGRNIEVALKYEHLTNLQGVSFELSYNPDILAYVQASPGNGLFLNENGNGGETLLVNDVTPGVLSIAWAGVEVDESNNPVYPSAGGTFCVIVFHMKEGSPTEVPLTSSLNLGKLVVGAVDEQGNVTTVPVQAGNGAVDVYEVIYGDVTGNQRITSLDARAAFRIHLELDQPTPRQLLAADVYGNGRVTALDARLIFRRHMQYADAYPFPVETD